MGGLRGSYDINDEFIPGTRAYYEENGARVEVQVLDNRSDSYVESYKLRLMAVKQGGPGFRQGNIGHEWIWRRARQGGGASCGTLWTMEEDTNLRFR